MKYNVLSPDGFPIHFENTYNTIEEAERATEQWIENYRQQGYYGSAGRRITLDELKDNCTLIELP